MYYHVQRRSIYPDGMSNIINYRVSDLLRTEASWIAVIDVSVAQSASARGLPYFNIIETFWKLPDQLGAPQQ
jgi:hypothetical protein